MPGPRPQDPYNPNTTVNPSLGMPSDYQTVRASPDAFGAQVGAAEQGLGQQGQKAVNQYIDIGIQKQGMLNETMATDAETQAASMYGDVVGKYKSTEGLEAVHGLPQVVTDLQQIRQKIRSTLPNPAAQRSFDLLAARREAYALQDVNLYAATQVKAADTKSANAALNLAIDQASDPSVAFNDAQFNDSLAGIKFQSARMLTNMGYGADSGTGMKQEKDGSLSFDESSDAGKKAKEVYDNYIQTAMDKVWTNRIDTIAFDPKQGNVQLAIDTLNQNKDTIPSATYARLSAKLAPAFKNAQARTIADNQLAPYQNYGADFFRSNYVSIVNKAREEAQKLHPDDPTFEDASVSRVEQRMGDVIRQQELMTRASQDQVLSAIAGKNNNGIPITSMDQIENGTPEIKKAFNNWLAQDPFADIKVNKLISANSKGAATSYGNDFYRLFSSVNAGEVTNPTDLMHLIGSDKNAILTNTGYNLLKSQIEKNQTPEGQAFVQQEQEFFNSMRGKVTLTGSAPGVTSPDLDQKFNKQLATTLTYIDKMRAEGHGANELFNEKSPLYAGRFIQPTPFDKMQRAKIDASISNINQQASTGQIYNKPEDLVAALRSKKITRDQFDKIAVENKWARPTPPPVPLPTP